MEEQFFSMKLYAMSMIARAIWSLIICVIACTGLGIAATNNLKHNYFEFFYFLIIFLIELSMSIFELCLFKKQRGLRNLESINRKDCIGSCIAIFLRLGWHIALSLFIIIRIHMENFMKVDYKWREVRDLTITILAFTLI